VLGRTRPWRTRVREVLLISKRGRVLFQHSKVAFRWTDEYARRFLEVVHIAKTSFRHEPGLGRVERPEHPVEFFEFGNYRLYPIEGDRVFLVVVIEGKLQPDERAFLLKTVTNLETQYGAALTDVQDQESIPGLDAELVQSLGLGKP